MDFAGMLFERQREALSRLLLGWSTAETDGGKNPAGDGRGERLSRRGASLAGIVRDGGSDGWEMLREASAARTGAGVLRGQSRAERTDLREGLTAGAAAAGGDGFPVDGSGNGAGGADLESGRSVGTLPGLERLVEMAAGRGVDVLEPEGLRQSASWRPAAGRQTRASFDGAENADSFAGAETAAGIQKGFSVIGEQDLTGFERSSVRGAEGGFSQDAPERREKASENKTAFRTGGSAELFPAGGQAPEGAVLRPAPYRAGAFSDSGDGPAQEWLPVLGSITASSGSEAQDLSRVFQRDARRYDGGFSLF